MKDSKYYKKMMAKEKKTSNNIWLSKLLISIIFFLFSLIITNFNENIRNEYKNIVLEKNISFSRVNKIYEKYIGGFRNKESDDTLVSSVVTETERVVKDENGSYLINLGRDYPLTFMESGIIVYIGEKDDLGNTIIVQGNDGVDLWYSNVINSDYSLYDYAKKGEILGTLNDDKLLLTIMKDGNKLTYDEYFK